MRISAKVLDEYGEALLTGGAWGTLTIEYDARYELRARIRFLACPELAIRTIACILSLYVHEHVFGTCRAEVSAR